MKARLVDRPIFRRGDVVEALRVPDDEILVCDIAILRNGDAFDVEIVDRH